MKEYALTVRGECHEYQHRREMHLDVWCMTPEESQVFFAPPMKEPGLYKFATKMSNVLKAVPEVLVYGFKFKSDAMLTYILQISTAKPTRFRISVVEGKAQVAQTIDAAEWKHLALCESPESVMTTLTPYLKMEEGE